MVLDKLQAQIDEIMNYESNGRFMTIKTWQEQGVSLTYIFKPQEEEKYALWLKKYLQAQKEFLKLLNSHVERKLK